MNSWTEQLIPIINEYNDGSVDSLDGDDVDDLCLIIKAKINLHEGNITTTEYNDILDRKNPDASPIERNRAPKVEEVCVACPCLSSKTDVEVVDYALTWLIANADAVQEFEREEN